MKTIRVPPKELLNLPEKEMSNIFSYERLKKEIQNTCSLAVFQNKQRGIIGGITLSPGNYCSAGCAYCYAKKRFNTSSIQTPPEVLKATFEFIRGSPLVREGCGITLGGGGDPLENFLVYTSAVKLSKRYKAEYDLNIPIYLATVEPWFLREEMIETILENQKWITLSVDGDMKGGVYHRRRSNYLSLIDRHRHDVRWAASGVFTAKTVTRVKHNYEFFMDIGFEAIQLRPARLPVDNPLSLKPKHFEMAIAQYDDMIQEYLKKNSLVDFISRLSTADSIGHFFFRYITGIDVKFRCAASDRVNCGAVFINSSGEIFPCPSTMFDCLNLGNVMTGNVNVQKLTGLHSIPDECKSCLISNVCGGPCMYESMLANNTPNSTSPHHCRFQLDMALLVQKTICELYETRPKTLTSILIDYAHRELGLTVNAP